MIFLLKITSLSSHTIDLLTTMPMSTYEELLTPVLCPEDEKDNPMVYEGMDMEAVCILLAFLERRLEKVSRFMLIFSCYIGHVSV